jgi:hypothetical protein
MAEGTIVQQLEALVQIPGALKVITNEHAHANGLAPYPEDCVTAGIPLDQPAHFVCHNVTEIEDVGGGLYRAKTSEGDWTVGKPEDLLRRLQQAGG